jgi:hypothetical protein
LGHLPGRLRAWWRRRRHLAGGLLTRWRRLGHLARRLRAWWRRRRLASGRLARRRWGWRLLGVRRRQIQLPPGILAPGITAAEPIPEWGRLVLVIVERRHPRTSAFLGSLLLWPRRATLARTTGATRRHLVSSRVLPRPAVARGATPVRCATAAGCRWLLARPLRRIRAGPSLLTLGAAPRRWAGFVFRPIRIPTRRRRTRRGARRRPRWPRLTRGGGSRRVSTLIRGLPRVPAAGSVVTLVVHELASRTGVGGRHKMRSRRGCRCPDGRRPRSRVTRLQSYGADAGYPVRFRGRMTARGGSNYMSCTPLRRKR